MSAIPLDSDAEKALTVPAPEEGARSAANGSSPPSEKPSTPGSPDSSSSKVSPTGTVVGVEPDKIKDEHDPAAVPDDVPEGGLQAWMTIAGVFMASFMSFGVGKSFSIIHSSYKLTLTIRCRWRRLH
jgi:hypothetical protein